MSQIMRRQRKGRPSKADLVRRESSGDGYELRRSIRRRNVRYNFDYDDYLDEDDEEDEVEEDRRRGKKMKLVPVLKLNQSRASADPPTKSRGRPTARGGNASEDEDDAEADGEEDGEEEAVTEEEEEQEDDDEDAVQKKLVKKRRINGGGEGDIDYDEEEEVEDTGDAEEDDNEERKGTETRNRSSSAPEIQTDIPSETPMPDKKSLELILDKLQKKDIYGVYAEPVDPEELPDYHDIIKHPMDFATVRKKLANGSYFILEEFESDVFLICSNAMQYNAPDTVYYKQARTIQDMAKKKLEKIRIKIERDEKELKTDQKVKPCSAGKKLVKQPMDRHVLEPVSSDFSTGANLATGGGVFQNGSVSTQTGGYEKYSYTDGPLEGNVSLVDSLEKAEDLSSGKGLFGKFGRKSISVEDNRRATFSMSDQPTERSESIFSTFEGEIKQLVAVGLHAEHAYTRSLARFTATLGPIAWKVASQRIEQALPAGVKFGRGWVGEYEPLPTPVLLLETSIPKESSSIFKSQSTAMPAKEQPSNGSIRERKPSLFQTSSVALSEGKPSFVASRANSAIQTPRASVEPQSKMTQQVELNLPPPVEQTNSAYVSEKQSLDKSDTMAYRSIDMMRNVSREQSEYYKPPPTNGICSNGLPNGKASTGLNSRMIDLSTIDSSNQIARAATCSRPIRQGHLQGLNSSEKAEMQHNSTHPQVNAPSVRSEDSSNAALMAARAWMSIGSGGHKQTTENPNSPKSQISVRSLYNPAMESELPFSARMQTNGFPFQPFVHQPVQAVANGSQRPMGFPQMVSTSDFNRFHAQSSWRGITTNGHVKQKQDNLPPDLNIGVHSPDSPAKHSSGLHVDSQHPDLALQL